MPLHTWFLFALAYLVTTISPGPNVLLVIRNSVRYGAHGTLVTIAGNLCSQLIVVVLVALGVGTVLMALPPLFIAMKVAGAAYLIYLGIKQLRGSRTAAAAAVPGTHGAPIAPPAISKRKIFREAVLVSGSNPKTMIFLSAFMPQFVNNTHSVPLQFCVMYVTIAATVLMVHLIYAHGVRKLQGGFAASRWLEIAKRSCGLLFVGLGIRLLAAKAA
jgi:threonine/homoserine/homoserine lactone efflux protein